jgi:HEPN domain-containing protein
MSEEEYLNWMEAADLDQSAAESLFQNEQYSTCTFHCQQAVEKALKACLYYSGRAIFSHSLISLAEELGKRLQTELPPQILDACRELDFHYITSRYPGASSIKKMYTREKAAETKEWMNQCLSYIKALQLT